MHARLRQTPLVAAGIPLRQPAAEAFSCLDIQVPGTFRRYVTGVRVRGPLCRRAPGLRPTVLTFRFSAARVGFAPWAGQVAAGSAGQPVTRAQRTCLRSSLPACLVISVLDLASQARPGSIVHVAIPLASDNPWGPGGGGSGPLLGVRRNIGRARASRAAPPLRC